MFTFSEFTTRASVLFFQEAPRSIAKPSKETTNKIFKGSPSDDGLKLRDKIEEILLNKAPHDPVDRDEEDENSQPFTVVRVSSSVSQVTVISNEKERPSVTLAPQKLLKRRRNTF